MFSKYPVMHQRAAAVALILLLSCFAWAQSLAPSRNPRFVIERDRVLPFTTETRPVGPFVSKISEGRSSVRWTQLITLPANIHTLSLHVRIAQSQNARWELRFKVHGAIKDVIGSDSVQARNGDAWSNDLIDGNPLLVELIADIPPKGLTIVIDKYDHPIEPAIPQGKFADMMQSILSSSNDVRMLGRSTARLRVKTDHGQADCTGFLISDDLLLTNFHCLATSVEAANTRVDFGFDKAGETFRTFRMDSLVAINTSLSYDYVLARVLKSPGKIYGHIRLNTTERRTFEGLGPPLVVIEHPGGGPKMVSIVGCEVFGEKITGVDLNVFSDFGHRCDTEGGSSGSPVFNFDTKELVGLHHAGYEEGSIPADGARKSVQVSNDKSLKNQAVYIGYILEDIKKQSTKLYEEITGIQGP